MTSFLTHDAIGISRVSKHFMKQVGKKAITCTTLAIITFTIWVLLDEANTRMSKKLSIVMVDSWKNGGLNCSCSIRTDEMEIMWENKKHHLESSSCDIYSTLRGGGQNVVSYSFYGDVNGPYFKGIAHNAKLVSEKYPGWTMRVYHDLDIQNNTIKSLLCPLWCEYHYLDFCYVKNLPAPLSNQSHIIPMVWRFIVLGDGLVDRFMSRDLDSLISDREVAAVNDWLKSGRTWHFMHDHHNHTSSIMGGMWGGINRNASVNKALRSLILQHSMRLTRKFNDQKIITKYLLPIAENSSDYINHDSFHCGKTTKSFSPWPVQRKSRGDFVGSAILRFKKTVEKPCQKKCRPLHHQNWKYC